MDRYFTTSTGVHVGRLYVNRTQSRPIEDLDMLRLQHALVKTKENQYRKKEEKYERVAGALALVMLFATMFLAKYALAKGML